MNLMYKLGIVVGVISGYKAVKLFSRNKYKVMKVAVKAAKKI